MTTARPLAVLALALSLASCGSGGEEVRVTMTDHAFGIEGEVSAGEVTFAVENQGVSTHEMLVYAVPDGVDPSALPLEGNVADTSGLELLGEARDVGSGASVDTDVTLEAGEHALICNIEGHYAAGMFAEFNVA